MNTQMKWHWAIALIQMMLEYAYILWLSVWASSQMTWIERKPIYQQLEIEKCK